MRAASRGSTTLATAGTPAAAQTRVGRPALLIGDGRDCTVDLGEVDGELFRVGLRPILQDADCDSLPELDG